MTDAPFADPSRTPPSIRAHQNITVAVLVFVLASSSTWFVMRTSVIPYVSVRVPFIGAIWQGASPYPYQYRVLEHAIPAVLEFALRFVIGGSKARHAVAYAIQLEIVFIALFALFYSTLRSHFTRVTALLGLALLQVTIPLAVTGFLIEGDFINLLAYTLAWWLMMHRRHAIVVIVVLLASFNREHSVALIGLHAVYLIATNTPTKWRYLVLEACSWAIAFWLLRRMFGVKSGLSPSENLAFNSSITNLLQTILPLWISLTAGFVVLSVLSYRNSTRLYRWSLIAVAIYTFIFSFGAYVSEVAKYLPAFLVYIPMVLQTLSGEQLREEPVHWGQRYQSGEQTSEEE